MKFHEKLRSIRQAANMNQTDLAEKLHVSRQAVSRWEMGSAMPDIENLTAMSDLFGVTVDYLLKEGEPLEIQPAESVQAEPAAPVPQEKKPSNRIWWIIWAVSFTIALAFPLINMYLQKDTVLFAINPITLVAQIVNLALTLGIVVLLIRWLCNKGSK